MRKLVPLLLFTVFINQSFGQQWKWWAANFMDESTTQIHEIAASPKGGAAMVVSANRVKTGGVPEEWTGLQNTLLITDVNGVPEKVIPLRFKVLKMTYGFDGKELFIIARDSNLNGLSYKLYVTTPLANDGFGFVDSVSIFNNSIGPNRCDIDMVMVGNVLNADVALVARNWATNIDDFFTPDHVWYFRVFLRDGKFTTRSPSIYRMVYSNKKILSSPEIETLAGDVIILSNREDEGYQLLRLLPNGANQDTLRLSNLVEKASISSSNGRLYLHAFFRDSLVIDGKTLARQPKGWAVVVFGVNFTVRNVVSGITTFDWLSDRYGSLNGKTLFDGGNYSQSFVVAPFHYYTRAGRRLGFFKFNSDLSEFDSTSFYILDFEPVPSNTIRVVMAPHFNGTYLSIPRLKTVKTLSDNILRFPKNTSLNAFAESGYGSLLLHYSNVEVSIKQDPNCFKTQFNIHAPFLEVEHVSWEVDGNRVRNHSFDTLTLFHQNFKENASVLARVRFSNGTNLLLLDSLYPKRIVYPKVEVGTSEICQWNKVQLRNNSTSDTFNSLGALQHIWEFWKNDTVFVSDTHPKPKVSFTKPGVYTLKYYASNGICKQGLVLKDTIKVLPAAKAQILGFPFPICAGSEVQLKPKPYPNTQHVFNWYDGLESSRQSSRIIKDVAYQWVTLTTSSANGCETKDSAYFRVRLPGNRLVDSVITEQDLTPTFYMANGQGFPKFRVERNDGSSNQVLWQKPSHEDRSVNLFEFDQGYTFRGIDSCGNELFSETWYPPILHFDEPQNRLSARLTNLGWRKSMAKRGSGKWTTLNVDLEKIQLDTLTEVYQFRYRAFSSGFGKVAVSNTVEITPKNQFILPNAFSPNGDGINDVFSGVKPKSSEIVSIKVFANNGQLVQHSTDIQNIWDGRIKGLDAPVGVYTYVISHKSGDETESLNGNVTLVK